MGAARSAGIPFAVRPWKAWVAFSPLLVVYLACVVLFQPAAGLVGDEGRYLSFADNLLEGFYSPPAPDINLWAGPGYPLFLALLKAFGMGLSLLRAANAFLLYATVVLTFETLRMLKVGNRAAYGSALVLALYYPVLVLSLPFLLTEVLAMFLIAGANWSFVRWAAEVRWSLRGFAHAALIGLFVAWLMLTKVMFAYAVACWAVLAASAWAVTRRAVWGRVLLVSAIALGLSAPYLLYTYSLTGRIFYWSNAGGMTLYCMSSPSRNETGSWFASSQVTGERRGEVLSPLGSFSVTAKLRENHGAFFESLRTLDSVQRDDAMKRKALANIRSHPGRYLRNWVANVGRMLVNYPYSHREQSLSTFFQFLPGILVLVLIVPVVVAVLRHRGQYPEALVALMLFYGIYLGMSSLVSAYPRMFYVTLPFWLVAVGETFGRRIVLRFLPAGEARDREESGSQAGGVGLA